MTEPARQEESDADVDPDRPAAPVAGAAGAVGAGAEMTTDAATERLRDEVWALLHRSPRQLSPKWFYDVRGSRLFEAITRLPEYYPTRTEQALLDRWAEPWMARLRPATLVELGAGSARKTRTLLDAMSTGAGGVTDVSGQGDGVYVPVDVSADFLESTARTLRTEYPALTVVPEVADLSAAFRLPADLGRPLVVALLGSTIGNFSPEPATRLLGRVHETLGPDDAFLMGADLRPGAGKSVAELVAAYDDAQGVTAEFNRNMLHVLNRRAGTDFEPEAFEHKALYRVDEGRIEMHLVASEPLTVRVPGRGDLRMGRGESIRTEISCKYDRHTVEALFRDAGLVVHEWVTDPRGRYALVLGGRI